MSSVWYYARDGKQTGPVAFDELQAAAAAGQIARADLVWQEGTPNWVAATTVPGLFAGAPPTPPRAKAKKDAAPEPLPLDDDDGPPHRRREPRESGPAADLVALAQIFARRAVSSNPGTITPTPDEAARLTAAGVADSVARSFAAWRRAVLWVAVVPTGFAALFGLIAVIDMEKDQKEGLSGFGILVLVVQALALFALPAAAVLAALAYDRLAASARWVFLGAAVSFGVPFAVAFTPGDWLIDLGDNKSATVAEVEFQKSTIGLLFGINFYLVLMPTVLSLLPAVSRACVRVKTFLPESLVPGWGLVASVPLFVLLTLATFVLLYHVAGNALLVLSLLLWVGAPLLYLTKFRLLTRPVADRRDLGELATTQLWVLGAMAAGVFLLVIYLFTAKFMGMTIVGMDDRKSMVQPWTLEVHKKWIEYVGRSLFLTILFADLLVRMALSVWREERAFAGTDGAAKFDQTMTGMGAAVKDEEKPAVK